jgi:segregation and condensation protein A
MILQVSEQTDNPILLKLNNFEGPFELLFHLLEKNEMDIYDIDINAIADQYLEYLSGMERLDLDIASEFLVMAATLLHIKSRMLLPDKKVQEDEEEPDPKEELVIRLLEYKKYKTAAEILKDKEEKWKDCFYKVPEAVEYRREYENTPMSISDLADAYRYLHQAFVNKSNKNRKNIVSLLKHELYSVKNKLKEITELFRRKKEFNFNRTFDLRKRHRLDVISGFLAVLELAKFHKVTLNQRNINDDIIVRKVDDIKLTELKEIMEESTEV